MFPDAGLTKLDLAALLRGRRPARWCRTCATVRWRCRCSRSGDRGPRALPQERARALPRLDPHGRRAQARGRRDPPGARQRRGRRSSTWRARTRSRRTSGRAAPTASSARTASSSTSTRLDRTSPRCGPPPAASATCCATSGLAPFAMTTGSRGLHVVAPLRRTADYEEVHAFAREVAEALVERDPDRLTIEFRAREARRPHLPRHRAQRLRPARGRALRGARPPRRAGGDAAALGGARRRRPEPAGLGDPDHRRAARRGGDPWAGIARAARAVGPARAALSRR